MSEAEAAAAAEFAFCGACGTSIPVSARFCRACGTDQEQLSEPPTAEATPPQPDLQPLPTPAAPAGLLDALAERDGLATGIATPGSQSFRPGGTALAGELSGLPARIEEGSRPDGSTPLVRVRFGVIDGSPQAAAKALSEVPTWSVSSNKVGVEIIATPDHFGGEAAAVDSYVEDLARRCAAAIELEGSTRPEGHAAIFSVDGFPQWVTTPDAEDVPGLELRHLELDGGQAEWEELAVRLLPTADGAVVATGCWEEEAPLISIMGRVALVRPGRDGGEMPVAFGSGVCTLTNRRLLGVIYARPDDDVLEGLNIGERMREAGIAFHDANGRSVDPFLSMPEVEKVLYFVDGAGSVDEEGGGVVLAFSARHEVFSKVEVEGGMVRRGLGIPAVQMTGAAVSLSIQPFRVLDRGSNTVKPRRGEVKEAVDAWWGMAASRH